MKKYIGIAVVLAMAVTVIAIATDDSPRVNADRVFHARLADPTLYEDGIYTDKVELAAGSYEFRFVPNGDSPRVLSIFVSENDTILFTDDFRLEGTPQGSESATYYTWDYLGQKQLSLAENRSATFTIDPHGDTLGPVTVQLIRQ